MRAIHAYRKATVSTASQGQIVVMLYDGFLKFGQNALRAMNARNAKETGYAIGRAMAIVQELTNALRPDANPELVASLASLYGFVEDQLLKSNLHRDPERLLAAINIMKDLRDVWAEAAKQV